ncbi:MAG: hypothetical protein E6772_16710 [Dysgonomonas sp.]|nr:hypothetical protein [Dysgonomonas sp.]
MMLKQIDDWLRDVKRQYAFGLAVFIALASLEAKKKYGEFLRSGENEDVAPNDPRFPMLINKVTAIYNIVKSDPQKYAEALATLAAPVVRSREQVKQIIDLKQERDELQEQVDELTGSEDDKTAEIEQLQEELEEKDSEIDSLKAELKEKGIKVMDGKDLPKSLAPKYERVKAIVPLMAAIHGELKDTTLTDEQRKAKAEELCNLDDERRALWDDIDAYLNDYDSVLTEEKKFEYSEDPVIRGAQIANRVKRLKENIKRNQESAERHKANNKPDYERKAREKVTAMESELKELESMLDEKK